MLGDAENDCVGRGLFGRVEDKECFAIKVDVKALAAIDPRHRDGSPAFLRCRLSRVRQYREPRSRQCVLVAPEGILNQLGSRLLQ
jgi:hypothetical protein